MLQTVINCVTVQHEWRLVVLACLVCLLASAVTISLFGRARVSTGATRIYWLALDACVAGCGIWATHFIAMLAYDPGVPVGYDIGLTILSGLTAIVLTSIGLAIALAPWGGAAIGGAIIGFGIAASMPV
jgi:NO-binding membrane sensor protein with MHYT domain